MPTLLVPKKHGTWRMCIDSKAMNNITIKYRFPMPRLEDMDDELHGATIFSEIDLRRGYHKMRIRKGMNGRLLSRPSKASMSEWLCLLVFAMHLVHSYA